MIEVSYRIFKPLTAVIVMCQVLTGLTLTSCGGGGGGSEFVGAAIVRIESKPTVIDIGDRTLVSIRVSDVHPSGIALKIRFPSDLEYVIDSSVLKVDGKEIDASPTVNTRVNSSRFLVYYLTEEDFGDDNLGELLLELVARASLRDGEIDVDADIDDPDLSNDTEFDPEDPKFEEDDSSPIRITG